MAIRQGEHTTLTTVEPVIQAFCHALAVSGVVGPACKQAGINRKTAYVWRRKWATFAQRWDKALEEFAEGLELEATWRAKSRDRPASASDAMLRFMLKASKPDKYGDKSKLEVDARVNVVKGYVGVSPDDWDGDADKDDSGV